MPSVTFAWRVSHLVSIVLETSPAQAVSPVIFIFIITVFFNALATSGTTHTTTAVESHVLITNIRPP